MVTLAMVAPCRHMQIDGQLVRAYNAFGRARGNDSREQGTLQGRSDAHGSIGETKPPVAPRKSLSQILNKLGHNADVGGAKLSPTLACGAHPDPVHATVAPGAGRGRGVQRNTTGGELLWSLLFPLALGLRGVASHGQPMTVKKTGGPCIPSVFQH